MSVRYMEGFGEKRREKYNCILILESKSKFFKSSNIHKNKYFLKVSETPGRLLGMSP